MSIRLFTGVTGSSKSYHAVCEILEWGRKRPVIANFALKDPRAKWDLLLPRSISPHNLIRIALQGHTCYQDSATSGGGRRVCNCVGVRWQLGKESACLLVLEEVTSLFQSREWDRDGRAEWLEFFNHHRKLGYEIILIAQYDRAVDVQIRAVIDEQVEHHKARGTLPQPFWILPYLWPWPIFMWVRRSYQLKGKIPGGMSFVFLKPKWANRYDSFALFNGIELLARFAQNGGGPPSGEAPSGGAGQVLQLPERSRVARVPDPSDSPEREYVPLGSVRRSW